MTECTIPKGEPEGNPMEENLENQWVVYVDRSSNANGLGAGLTLTNPKGDDIQYALCFGFPFTNNEAEYQALIAGLKISRELGVQHLKACSDSQLIVDHVLNEYEEKRV